MSPVLSSQVGTIIDPIFLMYSNRSLMPLLEHLSSLYGKLQVCTSSIVFLYCSVLKFTQKFYMCALGLATKLFGRLILGGVGCCFITCHCLLPVLLAIILHFVLPAFLNILQYLCAVWVELVYSFSTYCAWSVGEGWSKTQSYQQDILMISISYCVLHQDFM